MICFFWETLLFRPACSCPKSEGWNTPTQFTSRLHSILWWTLKPTAKAGFSFNSSFLNSIQTFNKRQESWYKSTALRLTTHWAPCLVAVSYLLPRVFNVRAIMKNNQNTQLRQASSSKEFLALPRGNLFKTGFKSSTSEQVLHSIPGGADPNPRCLLCITLHGNETDLWK